MGNDALRSEDRSEAKPYFKFLRLLFAALKKLLSIECVVARGICKDLSDTCALGCKHMWWAFSSASMDTRRVQRFMGDTGKRSLLSIHQKSGKDISRYSAYPEKEILLTPGIHFEVTEVMKTDESGDVTVYTIKEFDLPFTLFQ